MTGSTPKALKRAACFVALLLLAPASTRAQIPCPASPPDPSSVVYRLSEPSSFQFGCFGPCACPVTVREHMGGSFVLTPTFFDGLYQHYRLCEIDWLIPGSTSGGPPIHVQGSGTYRIGGQVAVQQELNLFVTLNGGDPAEYKSGLVPSGGEFPRIDIETARHGHFCWDSVLAVHAAPSPTGVPWNARGIVALRAVPNPSQGPMELSFTLRCAGRVVLTILDPQGRETAAIHRGTWMPAGEYRARWDGRMRDGSRAPAGVYLARLRLDGREETRAFVRL